MNNSILLFNTISPSVYGKALTPKQRIVLYEGCVRLAKKYSIKIPEKNTLYSNKGHSLGFACAKISLHLDAIAIDLPCIQVEFQISETPSQPAKQSRAQRRSFCNGGEIWRLELCL